VRSGFGLALKPEILGGGGTISRYESTDVYICIDALVCVCICVERLPSAAILEGGEGTISRYTYADVYV